MRDHPRRESGWVIEINKRPKEEWGQLGIIRGVNQL